MSASVSWKSKESRPHNIRAYLGTKGLDVVNSMSHEWDLQE